MRHVFALSNQLSSQFDRLLHLLKRYIKTVERTRRPKLQLGEPKIMFIVKDDNPDVNFSITVPTVNDSEGHPVDPQPELAFDVVSDDLNVVAVMFDPAAKTGSVHFGAPGVANVNATVNDAADNLVGSFGAQFTVTTGDPAAITGGGIAFDGLTES